MATHYTEPTTDYWQRLLPASEIRQTTPPFQYSYPARLPNAQYLQLPIRPLPTTEHPAHAVASLLVNAASLDVVDTLAALLAAELKRHAPDVVVGLPTLGHALCPGVARGLGHSRYVVRFLTFTYLPPPSHHDLQLILDECVGTTLFFGVWWDVGWMLTCGL